MISYIPPRYLLFDRSDMDGFFPTVFIYSTIELIGIEIDVVIVFMVSCSRRLINTKNVMKKYLTYLNTSSRS